MQLLVDGMEKWFNSYEWNLYTDTHDSMLICDKQRPVTYISFVTEKSEHTPKDLEQVISATNSRS